METNIIPRLSIAPTYTHAFYHAAWVFRVFRFRHCAIIWLYYISMMVPYLSCSKILYKEIYLYVNVDVKHVFSFLLLKN